MFYEDGGGTQIQPNAKLTNDNDSSPRGLVWTNPPDGSAVGGGPVRWTPWQECPYQFL